MAANHNRTENINATMAQLTALLRDNAFASKLNLELKSENPTNTGIWYRFHHGVTFSSWGEKITITLTPIAPNTVKLDIHSECGMPTQVIDWGKNKQNTANIYEYIVENVGRYPASINNIPPSMNTPAAPKTDKKFCFKCGTQLGINDVFCSKCGQKQSQ